MKLRNIIIIVLIIIVAIVAFFVIKRSLFKGETSNNEFSINYYKLYSNNKLGIIDKNGNIIIDAIYSDIIIPNPELDVFFVMKENASNYSIINKDSENIFTNVESVEPLILVGVNEAYPYEKQVLKYEENGKYGLITYEGKAVTKAIYEELTSIEYKENEFLIKQSDKYGIIDEYGNTKIDNKYDLIMSDKFSSEDGGYNDSGYIVAIASNKDIFYGYIDSKGKLLTKVEYDDIERIIEIKDKNNAYLIVLKNGKYGVVQNNKEIISFNYQEIQYDEISNLLIVKRNQNYGVLDMNGKTILPIEYSSIKIEGIYITANNKNKPSQKFDSSGVEIKNNKYEVVEKVDGTSYYTCQNKYYLYGLLDKNFNILVPTDYEYLEHMFNECFMARNKSGKYGLVNSQNQILIDFDYDVIQSIKDTKLIQTMDISSNKVFIFDENAKKIFDGVDVVIITEGNFIKVYYDEGIKYFNFAGVEISNKEAYPNNTILSFVENEKWGFKNISGEIVINPIYDRVTEFNVDGFAGIKTDDKWGSINLNGEIIVEPKYFIDDINGDPNFLMSYYRTYFGYSEPVYTDV